MDHSRRNAKGTEDMVVVEAGLGVPCPQAQADGVPCTELGIDCARCERAQPPMKASPPTASRGNGRPL